MKTVQQLAAEIVAREGGFVNDPSDPGGATKYGVTIGTMKALGLDLNKDGRVNVADVRVLTSAQAVEIYVRHYFNKPGINRLPLSIQPSVFDMYVNAGGNAIRVLQRLLTKLGWRCADDGGIGPQTAAAASSAALAHGMDFADAYGIARRDYYYALADARPASRKYARRKDGGKGGWIARAEEFIRPEHHLTDAQHRARVSSWG